MDTLNFSTGVVTYDINGKCKVSFNPTDSAFVERLFITFDELDKKQDAYKTEVEKAANNRAIFDVARARDAEMRITLDGLFGEGLCAALFEGMNVYSLADGLPVWCNLILAIMDVVDTTFAREQKATNPRLKKYTAKYHK